MKARIKTIVFCILLTLTAAAAMVTPWACAAKKENTSEKENITESRQAAESESDITLENTNTDTWPETEAAQGSEDGNGQDILSFAKSLEGENAEEARKQAQRSVVRLDVQGSGAEFFGSGVIWDIGDEDIVIVTSRHLLEEGELLRVVFPDGTQTSGNVKGICKAKDIGFVTVPEDFLERKEENIASSDKADKAMLVVSLHQRIFDTLDSFSALFVLGCSENGVGDEVRDAVLKDRAWFREEFGSDIMVLECEAKPGMSGGGLFDGYGNFAGMLAGGDGKNAAALSMETVNEAYEEVFGKKRNTEEY